MRLIPTRNCGDGYVRADVGSFSPYVAKTSDYTLKSLETGTTFSNAGATGSVTFTLPAPKEGMWFRFVRIASQPVVVTATNGARIQGSAPNGSYNLHGGAVPSQLRIITVWSDGIDWFVESGTVHRVFLSTEQTGTGSPQNIAHDLGVVPAAVVVIPRDLAPATTGQYTVTEGTHTATHIVVTVTSGKKYQVMAYA